MITALARPPQRSAMPLRGIRQWIQAHQEQASRATGTRKYIRPTSSVMTTRTTARESDIAKSEKRCIGGQKKKLGEINSGRRLKHRLMPRR